MRRKRVLLLCAVCVPGLCVSAWGQGDIPEGFTEFARLDNEYSAVKAVPGLYQDNRGIGILFTGTEDLHYYAKPPTEFQEGLELQIRAQAEGLDFGQPVFPTPSQIQDPALSQTVDVYAGDFQCFIPLLSIADPDTTYEVTVDISGQTCTSTLCLAPTSKSLTLSLQPAQTQWHTITIDAAQGGTTSSTVVSAQAVSLREVLFYFMTAVVAGLSINIMPCVLPVIPIIIMRLVEQTQHTGRRRIALGLSFCLGILLFFAAFALVSSVIQVTTGVFIDLNSLFRYPAAAIALFLMIVFFALIMLDLMPLALPSSVSTHQSTGSGVAASLGTGFFVVVLSIPCSGALLASVLIWAQTQPMAVSSLAILLMGVGMALPYGVVIAVPGLLGRLPKPGAWMELFKKSCGFLLLLIAAKLALAALPKDRLINVLVYGVVFSFCVWMWGTWVTFSTPMKKKWLIRCLALLIAVSSGLWLLPSHEALIDWQDYDAQAVTEALDEDRPVLLKFTADWCTNCKIVDLRVYQKPEIAELIETKGVLAIKADTTTNEMPATQDLNTLYGEAGNVPVTILLKPHADPIKLRGIFAADELKDLLKALPNKKTTDDS